MQALVKTKALEHDLHHLCLRCHYQLVQSAHHQVPKTLLDSVKEIQSLYDRKVVGENAYRDLLKFIISVYVTHQVTTKVSEKFDFAIGEKLSPERFLKALT